MNKFALVLSVVGLMMLGSGCASEVGDGEEDAVQQDDSTGSVAEAAVCRKVCHTQWLIRNGRRVRHTVCRSVCR
jgi:protein involved in sex pheromone biosynthesis